jgi:hypothetical protein
MFKSTDALNASCNAVTRLVDLGSTFPSGRLDIYDFTSSVLTQLNLSLPAFSDSTDGTAVSNFIYDSTALMDGTAISFGILNRDATTIWTGSVSNYSGSGDLKLNSTFLTKDSTVTITEMVYIVPPEFTYIGQPGVTGIQGVTGISSGGSGGTGIGPAGATGIQGFTGIGAGVELSFGMATSRYSMVDTTGEEVWCVSSSTVFSGLTWGRSGTILTMNRNSHGHSVGDRVIIRNTNIDYQVVLIDTTSTNSFTINTVGSGGTIGYMGAYSLGFNFAHNGSPNSGGILSAPTGDHADCQLISLKLNTGARPSTTYDLNVPASSLNGAGTNSNLGNSYVPDFNVRAYSDSLAVISATIVVNDGGSGYSTFQFGNLGSGSLSRILLLHF